MNLTTTYPGQQLDSGTLEMELSSCGDKQDQCDGDIDNVIVASNDTDGDITAREVAAEEKHPTSSETSLQVLPTVRLWNLCSQNCTKHLVFLGRLMCVEYLSMCLDSVATLSLLWEKILAEDQPELQFPLVTFLWSWWSGSAPGRSCGDY